MNRNLGTELIVYGILLAGLAYLAHHLAPTIARPTLITGLVGGALCLVWGILAVRGNRHKAWAILTLVPISYVLLSQAVLTWGGRIGGVSPNRLAPVLMFVMLVFSVGMLLKIAYAGATFDGQPPGSTKEHPAKPQVTGKVDSRRSDTQRG